MKFVDVDQHVHESPDLFVNFGFSKFADKYPRYGMKDGFVGWFYEDMFYGISKASTAAGQPWGEAGLFVPSESVPDGMSDPASRIQAMDKDNVEVALLYPSFMGLGGETMARHKDKEVGFHAVDAYNRWMQDFCSHAPERFIRVLALPLWSMTDTLDVLHLRATDGVKGVLFPQDPTQLGLPPIWDKYWDTLWGVCQEQKLVVCCHTLSDSMGKYMEMRAQPFLGLTMARMGGIETIAQWLLTDVLDRFPALRVMVGEAGVGWVPWFLGLANQSVRLGKYEFGRPRTTPMEKADRCLGLPILGSEPIHPGTLESLPAGLAYRIMYSTDYPHLDGSYPSSAMMFENLGLPVHMRDGVAHKNAREFFSL